MWGRTLTAARVGHCAAPCTSRQAAPDQRTCGLPWWPLAASLSNLMRKRTRNLIRRLGVLASTLVMAASSIAGASVLCIGEGGHLDIERLGEACCGDGGQADLPPAERASAGSPSASEPSCTDCIDVVLQMPFVTRPSSSAAATAAPELALPAVTVTDVVRVDFAPRVTRWAPDSVRPPLPLARLQGVLLRC